MGKKIDCLFILILLSGTISSLGTTNDVGELLEELDKIATQEGTTNDVGELLEEPDKIATQEDSTYEQETTTNEEPEEAFEKLDLETPADTSQQMTVQDTSTVRELDTPDIETTTLDEKDLETTGDGETTRTLEDTGTMEDEPLDVTSSEDSTYDDGTTRGKRFFVPTTYPTPTTSITTTMLTPTTSTNPCVGYKTLNEADRSQSYKAGRVICDSSLSEKWYRFSGSAGSQMPNSCVPSHHCGTHAPGWLNGSHPSIFEGMVGRNVCFHWSNNCCSWSIFVSVKNCGGFYVYKLRRPPACSLRYCGDGNIVPTTYPTPTTSTNPCVGYNTLNEADRSQSYKGGRVICDSSLSQKWYRFSGSAGSQMPNSCVPSHRCGTHAPGWLNGSHPSIFEGMVGRNVCFHWSNNCCRWSISVSVKNCGGFYVYKLRRPPACSLRYCGDGNIVPTTYPTPTSSTNPCVGYKTLNEADRSQSYKGGRVTCDSSLSQKWYRFSGSAGSQMPNSCVPSYRCRTHAPGWLNGSHPSFFGGVVTRNVCFHWSNNCCKWSISVSVKNCGGFYVYKLRRPPACSLRYCGDGNIVPTTYPTPTTSITTTMLTPTTSTNPCVGYKTLNEADRSQSYKGGRVICDSSISEKWYRFSGSAGSQMPNSCVPSHRCSTHAPDWLNGSHPSIFEGMVGRNVCFHWSNNCLPTTYPTPTTSTNPCVGYNTLNEADRSQSYKGGRVICDSSLSQKWYRFSGSAGSQMPNSCVPSHRCSTHAPGWLNGSHPSIFEGMVSRNVCFHWSNNCCRWSISVSVKNCGGFYVYKLRRPPACSLRYCGDGNIEIIGNPSKCGSLIGKLQLPTTYPTPTTSITTTKLTPTTSIPTTKPTPTTSINPCLNYKTLNHTDRSQLYQYQHQQGGKAICDSSLSEDWYRFVGAAGNKMPDSCVPIHRCGTHAPGWLRGGHPSNFQGVVVRTVCFHWSNDCCKWSASVSVKKCGAFYVYKLKEPPTCRLRYCGVGTNAVPTTTPTPTTPSTPCLNYKTLNHTDRSQLYQYQHQQGAKAICDSSLSEDWYRFVGAAGNKMPDSCVPIHRCGTHAPGWLRGGHPSNFQGVVVRTVCFHWSNDCCKWSASVSVKKCGSFYVYKLKKPPTCRLRYCGVGTNAPTPTSLPPTSPTHGFMILCLPDAMHVNIARDSLPSSFDPSLLHLSDSNCGVVKMDERNIVLSSPLDRCGTTRRSIGDHESFHNKVVAYDVGKKNAFFEFPFRCGYKMFGLPGQSEKREPLQERGEVLDSTLYDEETLSLKQA